MNRFTRHSPSGRAIANCVARKSRTRKCGAPHLQCVAGVLRPAAEEAAGFGENGSTYRHVSDQMPPTGAHLAAHGGTRATAQKAGLNNPSVANSDNTGVPPPSGDTNVVANNLKPAEVRHE